MNAKTPRQPKTLIGETRLKKANLRPKNMHFYLRRFIDEFPVELIGGRDRNPPVLALVEVHGMHEIEMDICQRHLFFRCRKWVREFFEHTDAKPGDTVQVYKLAEYRYEVKLRKNS